MLRSMARMSRRSGSDEPALSAESAQEMANAGRLKQIRMVAGLVNRANPRAMPIVFGSGLGIMAVLIVVGLLEVTGAWSGALAWLKVHMISGYNPPL